MIAALLLQNKIDKIQYSWLFCWAKDKIQIICKGQKIYIYIKMSFLAGGLFSIFKKTDELCSFILDIAVGYSILDWNGWKFIKVVICLRQGWSVLLLSNHNELNP